MGFFFRFFYFFLFAPYLKTSVTDSARLFISGKLCSFSSQSASLLAGLIIAVRWKEDAEEAFAADHQPAGFARRFRC